jgi:hypothetical protein
VGKGAVEYQLTRETRTIISKLRPKPLSFSSQPIFEMLAGKRSWNATRGLIKVRDGLTTDDQIRLGTLGLILPDPQRPHEALALRVASGNPVVPAVLLRTAGTCWDANAAAIHSAASDEATLLHFRSASVSALLDLATEAFTKLLSGPAIAQSNLKYLCDTGRLFVPGLPDARRWTIASTWPKWRRGRLSFPAMARDLSEIENRPELDADNLRQMCWRMGLKISDKTDA